MNDKSMRMLSKKLNNKNISFSANEQCSHCFSHAIAIAEGKVLVKLSPVIKKNANTTTIDSDSQFDDEDTEAEPADSEEAALLRGLLLKVCGFIAKVCHSPQAKKYFKKCYVDAGGQVLELLPFCKTRWGSWHGVITRLLTLKKAIRMFMNTADDSEDVPKVEKGQPKYESYKLSEREWTLLDLIHKVLEAAVKVQEMFSAEYYPTIWQILPAYEELLADWHKFATDH
ncbi:hypothetical protein AZE42_09793 [Rhizopogon vesiculosus]|uniref:Uncharacterized protein n=1 Tax=Rhizopogon vesiculosus TaxID=180088 RepID=A0A1J8Q4G5_9AGAM|nr:hypothetical protein AZE42_09793 [Rhizopogon vesiculosus]